MLKIGSAVHNGTYEILEEIGSGGGGRVFKAYHMNLRKEVAIKLILSNVADKADIRTEVDILKKIKNTYLPTVYDFIEEDGDVYTVMDFIEGENLETLCLKEKKRFTEKAVCKYMIQLCEAVRCLHSQNPPIIHSDIKPANIMLDPNDNICLIDFNISVAAVGGNARAVGYTQKYAAPEQFNKGGIDDYHENTRFMLDDETEITVDDNISSSKRIAFIDNRTDIYGMGATMYFLLTGIVPSGGYVNTKGKGVSKSLLKIVAKATAHDPSKRYCNTDEMEEDIKKIHKKVTEHIPNFILSKPITVYSNINSTNKHTKRYLYAIISAFLSLVCIIVAIIIINPNFQDEISYYSETDIDEYITILSETSLIETTTIITDTSGTTNLSTIVENIQEETKIEEETVIIPDLKYRKENGVKKDLDELSIPYKTEYIQCDLSNYKKDGMVKKQNMKGEIKLVDLQKTNLVLEIYKLDDSIEIKDYRGENLDQVRRILDKNGIPYTIDYIRTNDETVQDGIIIEQQPVGNIKITKEGNITINLSVYDYDDNRFIYYNDATYEGDIKNGDPNGYGIMKFNDGNWYEGEFKDGMLDGTGTIHFVEGDIYTGDFVCGERTGSGTYVWANGEKYVGQFVKGERTGYGVYYFSDGNRYEGEFKEGKFDGEGIIYYIENCDAEKYVGQFKNGHRYGKGTTYYKKNTEGEPFSIDAVYDENGTLISGSDDIWYTVEVRVVE